MNNLIKKIIQKENLEQIYKYVLFELYTKGPVSTTVLEILSYLYVYDTEGFQIHEKSILKYIGVNYKRIPTESIDEIVFGMYSKHIQKQYGYLYTPVQASIINGIDQNKCFSFSAPTSTGKSFVFRNIINACKNDVVIVVPSRALINEYYNKISEMLSQKNINILPFIDTINTKYATRSIFIVTPERCKELFKYNNEFKVDYFLFDEAQLSNETSRRGMYFDSIVRRAQRMYPYAKYVFAHPFVSNPEAQIIKNHFDQETASSHQFTQKNVGQMFFAYDNGTYYHFGIDKEVMGKVKVACSFDPIKNAIINNGSVLIYTRKESIYNGKVFKDFKQYINLCKPVKNKDANRLIQQIEEYIGASDNRESDHYSNMISMLKKGIVVHHGSLPLQARIILEKLTQKGFCRICFATSTLEQGINMPFEVVFLNTFTASRPLALKNLIGRAGRSTDTPRFDYGSIVIHKNNMSKFRDIMVTDDKLKELSLLEDEDIDEDFKEFRDAINNGTLSDEFNLTENQLSKLSNIDTKNVVKELLGCLFENGVLITLETINADTDYKLKLYYLFERLYSIYLNRELNKGERNVFDTAVKIMLWKIYGKSFKDICFFRYAYASRLKERRNLIYKIKNSNGLEKIKARRNLNNLYAAFVTQYQDIPNNQLNNYSMFGYNETKAMNVDYDRIVFDTYDYLDKALGFHLSDIFYAAFRKYFEETEDYRAEKMAKYVKYGTDDSKEIWMLRYGLSMEDMSWISEHIISIDQEEIVFKKTILDLDKDKIDVINRFIHKLV